MNRSGFSLVALLCSLFALAVLLALLALVLGGVAALVGRFL